MTEIGFSTKENFVARSSLVDARKVIKGIAEVVYGITPVTNWSVIVCHDSTNAALNATDIALSKVLMCDMLCTQRQHGAMLVFSICV
jgi:hypothetical protein